MSSNISKSQPTNINQIANKKISDKNSPNQIQPRESTSKISEGVKNNIQEPKKSQTQPNNFFEQTEINEKYFPQKANFFASENNDKIKTNLKSPIIDYFSPTSNNYLQKYNSPEEIIDANKNNKNSNSNNNLSNNKNNDQNYKTTPNMAYNLDQNFDFSPSNFFNNNNFIQTSPPSNSYNNNLVNPNNQNNEDRNSQTLQERIGLLVGKTDFGGLNFNMNNKKTNPLSNMGFFNNFNMNDFINNNSNNNFNNLNNNNINNANAIQQNEEDDEIPENQEVAYILNFNSDDDKDIEDDNNQNNNINSNNNNQNIQNNLNNIKNKENNTFNDNNNDKNENIGKKTLIKKDMSKPFIPNKFRNNDQQLNNIINNDENQLPSYEGSTYNNMPLNNNLNIKQNSNSNPQIFPNNNVSKINQINTTNNIFYPIMNNNFIYTPMNYNFLPYGYPQNDIFGNNNYNNQNGNFFYPQKIGEFLNIPMRPNNFNNKENNKFTNFNKPVNYNLDNNNVNHFYYNGDQYQISEGYKGNKNKNNNNNDSNLLKINSNNYDNKYNLGQDINSPKKNIYTISSKDLVTTITSNNKKIKRVNPKTYLNESYEYLAHNIFILSKDQAGCRFLQEKLEKDPQIATNYFYEAILPYILPLVKDPFGNYLIQKLCKTLDDKKIKKILDIIAPNILDIGSNSHGTRVIQQIINYLNTKELLNYFIDIIKPYTIQLLKELNGTHIIQKLLTEHPESGDIINKIIIDNCSSLATHRHGCCVLQKFLDGTNKKLKNELIQSLVSNCLVLITDQFGNYVIQSVLLLNDKKISSEIALKISGNFPYYSKHRYSSNVVEKCFDYCDEEEKKMFVEKISPPEILEELILDEHGNYVIQKALHYAEGNIKDKMLRDIIPLIPKIRKVSFGDRLLSKLIATYPQLNTNSFYNLKNQNYFNSNNNENNNNGKNGKNNSGYYNNLKNKYNNNENDNDNEIQKNNFENGKNDEPKNYKNRKNSKNDFNGNKNTK